MQYIWVVVISGEADNYYFSTAEKAYGYLIDRISEAALNATESNDINLYYHYKHTANALSYEYTKDESAFGCSYGWAFMAEVN